MRNPPSAAALRRLAYEKIQAAGPDWQERLTNWWVIGLRREDCIVARPVLAVHARWIMTGTRYALHDGLNTGETIAESVSVCQVRPDEWAALSKYLEQQIVIDNTLNAIMTVHPDDKRRRAHRAHTRDR
jgi:hypothetical protein